MKPLPAPPSTDASDPAVMRRAAAAGKARATRENKRNAKRHQEAMRVHEKRASLHQSGQLFDAFDLTPPDAPAHVPPYTADFMMQQRIECRANAAIHSRERRENERARIRKYRVEVMALVRSRAEYLYLVRKALRGFGGKSKSNRWYGLLLRMRRRLEPITDAMDLVHAWLEAWEGEPLTPYEIERKFGDGLLDIQQIKDALNELCFREMVEAQKGRQCTVSDVPFCSTWRAAPKVNYDDHD